jgi:hypothetical protein
MCNITGDKYSLYHCINDAYNNVKTYSEKFITENI